jgi:hypothetical protein
MAHGIARLADHRTSLQLHRFGYGDEPRPVLAWK